MMNAFLVGVFGWILGYVFYQAIVGSFRKRRVNRMKRLLAGVSPATYAAVQNVLDARLEYSDVYMQLHWLSPLKLDVFVAGDIAKERRMALYFVLNRLKPDDVDLTMRSY